MYLKRNKDQELQQRSTLCTDILKLILENHESTREIKKVMLKSIQSVTFSFLGNGFPKILDSLH